MGVEVKDWVNACRKTCNGNLSGMHVYIDSVTLQIALRNTNISSSSLLQVKRYPLKSNKNTAKILISIKEVKNK